MLLLYRSLSIIIILLILLFIMSILTSFLMFIFLFILFILLIILVFSNNFIILLSFRNRIYCCVFQFLLFTQNSLILLFIFITDNIWLIIQRSRILSVCICLYFWIVLFVVCAYTFTILFIFIFRFDNLIRVSLNSLLTIL